MDIDRHVSPKPKTSGVEKEGGNPFASFAGHMGRAFREAAKPRKKDPTSSPVSTPKPPQSAARPTPDA